MRPDKAFSLFLSILPRIVPYLTPTVMMLATQGNAMGESIVAALQQAENNAPQNSQHSLLVITFDGEKHTPTKTLYYVNTLNNLVEVRREGDEVLVGGRWRPRQTSMEHLQLHTRSILELTWKETGTIAPNLFRPDSLAQPSGLEWPARAATQSQTGTGS
jgi:hypothetical protein